ncbi:MAG: outer membrane protein assembly factor BamD [Pyrinomonadaceae bacterium]
MSKQSLRKESSNILCGLVSACLRLPFSMRIVICVLAAAATAIGCGWFAPENSIRFNGFKNERQMGRLPPLPTLANGKTELSQYQSYESGTAADGDETDYETTKRRTAEADALWEQAETAETSGELGRARELLREYLERTSVARDPQFYPADRQLRRNSAIDRLDALSALDKGARASAVQSYLNARRIYDAQESPLEGMERFLDAISTDEHLRDNAAYLRAAVLYRDEQQEDAVRDFKALASRYPRSEKREAALYMAALSTMKMSYTFTGTSGDEAHLHAGEQEKEGATREAEPERRADCCDDAWQHARAAFERVMREYPRGRYQQDARGWLAYLRLRGNDRAGALVEYYRMLGDEKDMSARLEAAFSLTLVRHHASDDEMGRVEKELEDEPAAALAYAYHNIYNYAINPGCQLNYDWADDRWEWEDHEAATRRTERGSLERVAAYATRLMRRYPRAPVGGQFALRVAEANLELGENRSAAELAGRALSLNLRNEERANALWIKGVAEHRQKDYDAAWRTLTQLLDEDRDGRLTEGARRHLAMIAEDRGDMDAALEQYMILKYTSDVAYFIDVLMTPEQLDGFIERHPNHENLDTLLYGLGLRYLRARRWDDARATFARIRTKEKKRYVDYSDDDRCAESGFACIDPKETFDEEGVSARLLMRDIKTADVLQRLEQEASMAVGDEAQAEALYQLASYQYEASTLLFYNPVAWQGTRYGLLSELDGSGSYRAPNEAQTLWQHMQEHEAIARALVIYLDIVRRFPKTRAARDALYTAAVCHERLSDFNPYWREMYQRGLHAGQRMVTYDDVRRMYPDYRLPRGTRGWEPSTRTVNGGAGWDAPPKPQPRPSRLARLKLKLEYIARRVAGFWEQRGRRWLAIWFSCVGLLSAAHLAAQARRLMRQSLARSDSSSWRRTMTEMWRLRFSRRGRSVLAFNVMTHTLLAGLALIMIWTWRSG